MAAAFQFGMPAINFKQICNIKRTHRQRKQRQRKIDFFRKKWEQSYAYQCIIYGNIQIVYYNDLSKQIKELYYNNIIPHVGIQNEISFKLMNENILKCNNMIKVLEAVYAEIQRVKDEVRHLIVILQCIDFENLKELSQFTNTYIEPLKIM